MHSTKRSYLSLYCEHVPFPLTSTRDCQRHVQFVCFGDSYEVCRNQSKPNTDQLIHKAPPWINFNDRLTDNLT